MLKKVLLALFCAACVLPLSGVFAQAGDKEVPAKAANSSTLDGNYVLTLIVGDKGKDRPVRELSVVIATPAFSTSSAEQPALNFTGSCTPQGDGTYLVAYSLNGTVAVRSENSLSYRTATTQATVRLRLDEPVQISNDGELLYTLKLYRYKVEAH